MNDKFYELDSKESLEIDGGIAPVVVLGIKIVGAGILAGAGWRLGEAAYEEVKSWF